MTVIPGQNWEPIESYDPVGGNVALDLVNTSSARKFPTPHEKLFVYDDLVVWGERTGLLDADGAAELRTAAEARPAVAQAVLERALELREALYRVFAAVAGEGEPPASDLELLNAYLAEAASHRRVERRGDGWAWSWDATDEPLAELLWPAAWAAGELLAEGDLTRVKECGSENCNWLFVDLSRNRSRRWCDMKDCGNRAKARRHYRRVRGGAGSVE